MAPVDKLPLHKHPRMASKNDLLLISSHSLGMCSDDVIVEMGPWLGFFSRELAKYGQLHVVDNFIWTSDHERRLPGRVQPGKSFRTFFEKLMNLTGTQVTIHEADFAVFEWSGPEISMLVIDAAKTKLTLQNCLSAVIHYLKPNAKILLKNGLNTKYHDMVAYIQRLVNRGYFRIIDNNTNGASNILILEITNNPRCTRQTLIDFVDSNSTMPNLPPDNAEEAPPMLLNMMTLAQFVETGNWVEAFRYIDHMTPDLKNIKLWDKIENTINTNKISLTELAMFSEIFYMQNIQDYGNTTEKIDISRSSIAAVRAFWANNSDKDWRGTAFQPSIILRASEFGYMAWPQRLSEFVHGCDIIDIGCGPGLHGLGFLCLGAKSVLGVDPKIRTDRDRVKNLVTKSRLSFGWTPDEISKLIPPWQILPVCFEDFETDRVFDLAVLHDCLLHVADIESVIAKVASQLRPGGRVIFRHKNFYSWNGHGQSPKMVSEIDTSESDQKFLIDWKHLTWTPPSDHYVSGLNRMRLDDLMAAVERHFNVEVLQETNSTLATGLGRLNPVIRARHPELIERDFLVQNVFCVARLT